MSTSTPDDEEARPESVVNDGGRATSRSAVVVLEPSPAFSVGALDRLSRRVHVINLSTNLALLFGKSYVFFQSGSVAILASLVDSAIDLIGQGMLLWCVRAQSCPRWRIQAKNSCHHAVQGQPCVATSRRCVGHCLPCRPRATRADRRRGMRDANGSWSDPRDREGLVRSAGVWQRRDSALDQLEHIRPLTALRHCRGQNPPFPLVQDGCSAHAQCHR